MRNTIKFKAMLRIAGIIALAAIIGFGFTACDDDGCDASCLAIGATGPGDGIIIYHNHAGFTVTGAGSFTAYYLEAAPVSQGDIRWCSCTYPDICDVTGAAGTAIGTGKANTAAIIAAHSDDTALNNAAKACNGYSNKGKSDWFLPSKDELNEMYKARSHLGISSYLVFVWSSSQRYPNVWCQHFEEGYQGPSINSAPYNVRAVRAF